VLLKPSGPLHEYEAPAVREDAVKERSSLQLSVSLGEIEISGMLKSPSKK
jgi:hypothetical protein